MRVLFVCLGNICRSPTAETVFRSKAGKAGLKVEADSAGTGNWHIGKPPHSDMQAAAKGHGYDMSDLAARQVSQSDFADFDLIIAMDAQNLADLQSLRPDGTDATLALMSDYGPSTGPRDVPDPYFTGDFVGTLGLIEVCSDGLVEHLQESANTAN